MDGLNEALTTSGGKSCVGQETACEARERRSRVVRPQGHMPRSPPGERPLTGSNEGAPPAGVLDEAYALRLKARSATAWKRALDVQAPFRWNLRRLQPGYVLDLGCGIGRNLVHVRGVGVDPNPGCVAEARAAGLLAYSPEAFAASDEARPERFDSLLVAHVLEHMTFDQGADLVRSYLPFIRKGGQVILMTPQEAGFRSDHTHVEYMDRGKLGRLLAAVGLRVEQDYSFPFPRPIGLVFPYNEFIVTARV